MLAAFGIADDLLDRHRGIVVLASMEQACYPIHEQLSMVN